MPHIKNVEVRHDIAFRAAFQAPNYNHNSMPAALEHSLTHASISICSVSFCPVYNVLLTRYTPGGRLNGSEESSCIPYTCKINKARFDAKLGLLEPRYASLTRAVRPRRITTTVEKRVNMMWSGEFIPDPVGLALCLLLARFSRLARLWLAFGDTALISSDIRGLPVAQPVAVMIRSYQVETR
ncbi:hypothetical protein CY34DRAFT_107238 [Suillus luteus UH-Slu-Lm8-n1]|uniref:Uncharacterized protein n=1 Tax=Suillus luteus UH-Slu-Lm8-n1 TaxID=930992 RepID=A0A0D0BEB2_9AGAM|nr:hypothetical protein CY34DRAFT_107238 [Suillus luteus UH-Slu-Lm8-n1]